MTDPAQEEVVVDYGVIQDTEISPVRETVVHAGLYDEDATAPSTEPTELHSYRAYNSSHRAYNSSHRSYNTCWRYSLCSSRYCRIYRS